MQDRVQTPVERRPEPLRQQMLGMGDVAEDVVLAVESLNLKHTERLNS